MSLDYFDMFEYLFLIVKSKTRSCILFPACLSPLGKSIMPVESCDVTCVVRIHGVKYLKLVSHKNVGPSQNWDCLVHMNMLFRLVGRLWSSLFGSRANLYGTTAAASAHSSGSCLCMFFCN